MGEVESAWLIAYRDGRKRFEDVNTPVVVWCIPGVGQAGHGLVAGLGRDRLRGGASSSGHGVGDRRPRTGPQHVHTKNLVCEGGAIGDEGEGDVEEGQDG